MVDTHAHYDQVREQIGTVHVYVANDALQDSARQRPNLLRHFGMLVLFSLVLGVLWYLSYEIEQRVAPASFPTQDRPYKGAPFPIAQRLTPAGTLQFAIIGAIWISTGAVQAAVALVATTWLFQLFARVRRKGAGVSRGSAPLRMRLSYLFPLLIVSLIALVPYGMALANDGRVSRQEFLVIIQQGALSLLVGAILYFVWRRSPDEQAPSLTAIDHAAAAAVAKVHAAKHLTAESSLAIVLGPMDTPARLKEVMAQLDDKGDVHIEAPRDPLEEVFAAPIAVDLFSLSEADREFASKLVEETYEAVVMVNTPGIPGAVEKPVTPSPRTVKAMRAARGKYQLAVLKKEEGLHVFVRELKLATAS